MLGVKTFLGCINNRKMVKDRIANFCLGVMIVMMFTTIASRFFFLKPRLEDLTNLLNVYPAIKAPSMLVLSNHLNRYNSSEL